jgi:hypothetical protein
VTSWLKAKFGRARVSTIVLIVVFLALFWVYHNFEPQRAPTETPTPAVVPPGFVPDPNYTWVPRTNVRRPKEDLEPTTTTTTTTTSPTETTTTSPGETTSPTSPTSLTPTTTIVPGPLGPTTYTLTPTPTPPMTASVPAPGPALTTPAPPG